MGNKNIKVSFSKNISVIVSMTLVLFILGLLGLLLVKVERVNNYLKESFSISITIDNNATLINIEHLRTMLLSKNFVKYSTFISKDSAAKEFEQQIGEDFLSIIGDNPLSHSIDVQLNAEYISLENMREIKDELLQVPIVLDVVYDDDLLAKFFSNARKIGVWLFILSILFLAVSFILINNSIRLTIYSKRFLIRTQQMVGATKSFIRKPFMTNSIWQGIFAPLFAAILLGLFIYKLDIETNQMMNLFQLHIMIIIFVVMLLLGIVISVISTYFATEKYLNLKTEELY